MNQERWQKIEFLYHSARELPAADRSAYLDESCAGDPSLREEVASLLAEAEAQDDFLSKPTLTLGLSLLAGEQTASLRNGQLGPYRIIKQLGRGGMGEVYLARDSSLERLVALKLLPSFLNQQNLNVQRFELEARAASGVSHPNVAHIYMIGEADGHHYIAMEYVEGVSLRALLSRQPLMLMEAVRIALQVARAVGAAHAAGVVHRDIKPENIIIRHDGLVKVVDFGLAKLTEPQNASPHQDTHDTQPGSRVTRTVHTEPGVLMGTANYMSPEQARCQEVDARTDIWSWGVVFFEMLTGHLPFMGATNSDVIAEILKSEPPLSGLPDAVRLILQKSLSKEMEDRYRAMPELLGELEELLRQIEENRLPHLSLPVDKPASTIDATQPEDASRVASPVNPISETNQTANRPASNAAAPTSAQPRAANTLGEPFASLPPSSAATSRKAGPVLAARSKLLIGAGGLLVMAVALVAYSLIGRQAARSQKISGPPALTHLTHEGQVMDVAISGDARLLAVVQIEAGKQSLWINDLVSGEKWQLLPPDPALCWGLRFTPNGQSLFYITTQPSSTISVLYRMPVRGGPSQKLVVNIDAPLAVSPDGMQIAFVRSYPGQHRDALIVANVDGSAEQEMASRQHPDKFSFSGASWSPDSKLIALGASRNNETEFAVIGIPVKGGAPVELTPWQWTAVRGVAWNNDGRSLLFSARAADAHALQIWQLSYPDGQAARLTNDENDYEEINLAQNERTLVTTQTYEFSSIWAESSTGVLRRLTTEGHEGADGVTVTPRGRIIYTVGENEQSSLWSMNMEGGDRKPLVLTSSFLPSASPDGRFIAYVSRDHDAHHIWLMDADGQNNRQLTGGGGEKYPSFTPDGNWVVYTSLAKERGSLWKISTSGGGAPIQLTRDAITMKPVVSPDGTKIACTYRTDETDKWKIAVLPFDGGQPLVTFAFPYPYNQIIRWTSDSSALIYLDKRNGVHNLWRQPLDQSQPTQITNFTEDLILHYNLLNRETELVLSRGGRRREIVLIKNF
jgi:serine/threonine protein kinase/Tol biopolymer transport system component